MPRRPAQREHRALAGRDQALAGQRDLRGGMHRAPGARCDRRAGIDGVVAELAVDRVRYLPRLARRQQPRHRPDMRQRVEAAARRHPVAPAVLQEGDETAVVHGEDRIEAEVARSHHLAELLGLHALEHDLGAARNLVRLHHLAFEQLDVAVLVMMLVAVDRVHVPCPRPRDPPTSPKPADGSKGIRHQGSDARDQRIAAPVTGCRLRWLQAAARRACRYSTPHPARRPAAG